MGFPARLKAGDRLLVNGTLLVAQTNCLLTVVSYGRFLLGKQVLAAEDATTPLRRLYYALQQAYAGPEEQKEDQWRQAVRLHSELGERAGCVSNVFRTDDPAVFLRLLVELRKHIERQERIAA